MRKPDPRIYRHACELLGVAPEACVYLDDLGINLKPARAMGMATIKVDSAAQALAELEALLGMRAALKTARRPTPLARSGAPNPGRAAGA